MADFNSSLPVRTQNNGDVVVNIADGTTETQKLAVDASGRITTKMDDGNGNPVTSQANGAQQALDVGINVAGAQIDPRLVEGAVTTAAPTYTTGTNQQISLTTAGALRVDASGTIQPVSGTVTANQGTPNTLANGWPVEITDGTNKAAVKAASTAALATDPSLVVALSPNSPVPAGTNLIGGTTVYVGSTVASVSNPLPVTIISATPGTPVQDYHTSASLAAGSSVTFTYTVAAAHTFSLERVWASASGKIKVVVQNGASTIFTAFNSTATPNVDITVVAPPTIAAAGTVNVIITNDDIAAMDVYATIEGNQN